MEDIPNNKLYPSGYILVHVDYTTPIYSVGGPLQLLEFGEYLPTVSYYLTLNKSSPFTLPTQIACIKVPYSVNTNNIILGDVTTQVSKQHIYIYIDIYFYPDDVLHQKCPHACKNNTRISVYNGRLQTVIHWCITVLNGLSLTIAMIAKQLKHRHSIS